MRPLKLIVSPCCQSSPRVMQYPAILIGNRRSVLRLSTKNILNLAGQSAEVIFRNETGIECTSLRCCRYRWNYINCIHKVSQCSAQQCLLQMMFYSHVFWSCRQLYQVLTTTTDFSVIFTRILGSFILIRNAVNTRWRYRRWVYCFWFML